MTKKEIKNALRCEGVLYAQAANQPSWFRKCAEKGIGYIFSATSGSHFKNEWYVFESLEAAKEWIAKLFNSQSFVDRFCYVDGEFYEENDTSYNEDTDEVDLLDNAAPADVADMIWAESAF